MKKTFYTTQSIKAWEMCKKTGLLRSSLQYEDYPKAYEWMKKQMESRIYGYSKNDGLIWLETCKPNYKVIRKIKSQTIVVLKVKVDKKKVLPSLFYPWDIIRSNLTLYNRILEEEFYEMFSISPEEIFITKGYDKEEIQYTTGSIYLNDIKLIKIIK